MSELPSQRTRRNELDRISRLGVTPLVSPFEVKVVGVTHTPTYPQNLMMLHFSAEQAASLDEPLSVIVVRNPDNEMDPNACEIHVPALGESAMVGWLPTAMAARLAPELDAGARWQGGVVAVLITPGHEDRPGISINLHRVVQEDQHG
jgi:hypothetical protein